MNTELIQSLANSYAPRRVRYLHLRERNNQVIKVYGITLDDRSIPPMIVASAEAISTQHASTYESAGTGVDVIHIGADGTYLILLRWIEGFMSTVDLYLSADGQVWTKSEDNLAPCIWERAILDFENQQWIAVIRAGASPASIHNWQMITLDGMI